MEVEAENWMLNTLNVIHLMVGSIKILCWLLSRSFAMNRDNLEVEPNMSVRQSSGPDAMNAGRRTDICGKV